MMAFKYAHVKLKIDNKNTRWKIFSRFPFPECFSSRGLETSLDLTYLEFSHKLELECTTGDKD